jgi:hypothetical protein
MKQDAENVGPAKYKIGDIVVVDLSIDKAIGYVLEVQETDGIFNGWYKIYEYLETNGRHIFEARQEWMETYEEFESRGYSKIR